MLYVGVPARAFDQRNTVVDANTVVASTHSDKAVPRRIRKYVIDLTPPGTLDCNTRFQLASQPP
jgi:hypothetical protein